MKNFYILFFTLFTTIGFSQDFQWARQFSGINSEYANAIEVDGNGNSYVFGTTQSPIFDLNSDSNASQIVDNTVNYTNHGGTSGIFLVKNDTNGNFIWGKMIGDFIYDKAIDIKIGSDGNIYLLAILCEYTTFIKKNIALIKLDSNGTIILTKKLTNLYNPNYWDVFAPTAFDIDNQNNIYITGYFHNRLKLDPTNPALDLISGRDSFLLKLNNLGDLVWAKKFNIDFTNFHYEKLNVRNDQNINLILSDGDNQRLPDYGYKIFNINSSDGSIIWTKHFEKQWPIQFEKNNLDQIIVIGRGVTDFSGPQIDIDPSANTYLVPPHQYVLWLDNNGDFLDARSYLHQSLTGNIFFTNISTDVNNNTFLIGWFVYNFNADPPNNTYNLSHICPTSSLTREAFSIELDNNRNFVKAFKLGDYNNNCSNFYFNDLKIVNDQQYYIGDFSGTADLDPSSNYYLMNNHPNSNQADCFVLKLANCDSRTPVGNSDQYFCSSQNPTITNLSPNSNYIKWYNSLTSTTQLPSTDTLLDGQTYYATEQIGACPESTTRLAVTVHITQTPIPPLASNQAFCENDHASISNLAVTGQNLNWYNSQTGGNLLATSTILQNNTIYYVSQTVNNCESNRTPISITIKPSTIPTLTSPQNFCIQQNATLNTLVITGQNIRWYDALTNGNVLANTTILQNGMTYYASQTVNGCESLRVPVTINIQNTPTPVGSSQSFCATQNPTLNDIIITGTGINWYSSTTSTTALSTTTALVNGVTYYATQTINGCESVNRLPITISLINTLNAADYAEILCDDLNDGNENINLTAYNPNLISNTSGCTFEYYNSLLGATNQSGNDQITNANTYSLGLGLKTIYVRITSSNGCHQIVELQLTLVSKPIINISDIMPICEGNSITIDAGIGYDSYLWSTGATTSSIVITNPDNYSVTATENHGTVVCSSTKNFSVVQSNMATISEVITSDWTVNENTITVLLTGSSVGLYEYSLDGTHYQASNIFSGLENGEYTVFVRDKNGCGIRPESFYLLMYPKFFTPNGDGFNDTWKIKFSKNEPNLTVKLFDRFGKLLKAIDNKTGWDGTLNNQELPATDYWFVVTRQNGKEYKGHFALKR